MTGPEPVVVPVVEGFRRWAPTYEETALSLLEVEAFRRVAPGVEGRRLLDAACGTGRRLPAAGGEGPALAVGVDLVAAMLRRGEGEGQGGGQGAAASAGSRRRHFAQADVAALPFRDGAFDVVWCRLTLGFLSALAGPLGELRRVLAPGGALVLTDLHPDSTPAGHVRSFRDAEGVLTAVAHRIHPVEAVEGAASGVGLTLAERVDLEVGPTVRDAFERFGGGDVYRRLLGRPVVLALRFTG